MRNSVIVVQRNQMYWMKYKSIMGERRQNKIKIMSSFMNETIYHYAVFI
jgi:hypothetical protein